VTLPKGYGTEALVLRAIPFAETSQVVHLATPEHGLVAAFAKGAHRGKGEFQGGVPLGAVGEARLVPRKPGEMELLRSFRSTMDLRGLGRDLVRYGAASYVLELTREWMRLALPNPGLFRASVTTLRVLSTAAPSAAAGWVAWFEARAIAAGGHRPRLDACAVCSEEVERSLAVFSPLAGGLAHAACAPPGPALRLSPAALESLRHLYSVRLPAFVSEPMSPAGIREVRLVHDLLVPHLLERRPRSWSAVPRG
jgi:DNA repair protein RecO (recombination protein O)